MRKERDWSRTLACKLLEERRVQDGESGMDMLWETYEEAVTLADHKAADQLSSTAEEDQRSRDEDDDEVASTRMCCLQVIRMSSGRVNMGMGRKSAMLFSKALRGLVWLHRKTVNSHTSKN